MRLGGNKQAEFFVNQHRIRMRIVIKVFHVSKINQYRIRIRVNVVLLLLEQRFYFRPVTHKKATAVKKNILTICHQSHPARCAILLTGASPCHKQNPQHNPQLLTLTRLILSQNTNYASGGKNALAAFLIGASKAKFPSFIE